jgi:hypothetical protein
MNKNNYLKFYKKNNFHDFKLKRHYIFINPNNINEELNTNFIFNKIKKIHKKYYVNNEIIKYWGYNDIANLLNKYDKELYQLFINLNPNYPALLADIGRYIILYYNGGVYHDLKMISYKSMINYINDQISNNIIMIGDEHPIIKSRVRNTNIISLQLYHPLFNIVLQNIKKELIIARDQQYRGPDHIFNIGSGIYINKFNNFILINNSVIKYPLEEKELILFNFDIYSKNIKRWQKTDECLFLKF